MPPIAEDRICHVYRNKPPYPSSAHAVKHTEDIGGGTLETFDICGLPLEHFTSVTDPDGTVTNIYRCPECDRPRQEWPTTRPSPSL